MAGIVLIFWLGACSPGSMAYGLVAGPPVADASGAIALSSRCGRLAFGGSWGPHEVVGPIFAAQFSDVRLFIFELACQRWPGLSVAHNGSTLVSQLVDTSAVVDCASSHYAAHCAAAARGDTARDCVPQLGAFSAWLPRFKCFARALLDTLPFYCWWPGCASGCGTRLQGRGRN